MRWKRWIRIAPCLLMAVWIGCGNGVDVIARERSIVISNDNPPQEKCPIVSQILVQFKPESSPGTMEANVRSVAAKYSLGPVVYYIYPPDLPNWYLFVVPSGIDVNATVGRLQTEPTILSAEPNGCGEGVGGK